MPSSNLNLINSPVPTSKHRACVCLHSHTHMLFLGISLRWIPQHIPLSFVSHNLVSRLITYIVAAKDIYKLPWWTQIAWHLQFYSMTRMNHPTLWYQHRVYFFICSFFLTFFLILISDFMSLPLLLVSTLSNQMVDRTERRQCKQTIPCNLAVSDLQNTLKYFNKSIEKKIQWHIPFSISLSFFISHLYIHRQVLPNIHLLTSETEVYVGVFLAHWES